MLEHEIMILFLASYSLTFGWIESPLFNKVKNLNIFQGATSSYLTFCYHCCGFWISFILLMLYYRSFFKSILLALSFSITMLWLNTFLVFIQSYIRKN